MLPGKEATVPAFLDLARNHTIVHFAGHALVNSESPFRSMLVLAPSSHRSGALDVEELLTELELQKTRLFVLSTCSGAGGVDIGPDGLAPLLRPIVAAGVPGTVGSLWDVGSAATEELLVQFHRYYHDGNDADRALQLAQLNLMKRKEAGLKTVLAWAPFEVIGHASSPFAPKTR
jgi:CHAT domain-containing protein